MAISSVISSIQSHVADAYTALSAKGATMPSDKNIQNIASAIGTISGDGQDVVDSLISRTVTSFIDTSGRYSFVGDYAFAYCRSLQNVSFPSCSNISAYAFYDCYSLSSVSFPECSKIQALAFAICSSLTSVYFPKATSLGVAGILSGPFYNCTNLESAAFPICTYIGGSTFQYCSKLTSVSLPEAQSINNGAFCYCTKLSSISLPKCKGIGQRAFESCSALSILNLKGVPSVPRLTNVNAFYSSPMSDSSYLGYYGSIYVDASLYQDFIASTTWALYSDRITSNNI